MEKDKEAVCLFDVFQSAHEAKKDYERLKEVWKNAKKVFTAWDFEEKEQALSYWDELYYVMPIYDCDMECKYHFESLRHRTINREQFEEKMEPQIKQVEDELSKRKKKYESCRRQVSIAYDNWVKEIPQTSELKIVKILFKQPETKRVFIEGMMEG